MVVGHRRVTYARSVDRDHRRVFLHAYQSDIDLKHTRPQHAVYILGVVGGGGGVYVCRVCVWGGDRHACIHNEHTMRVPLCTQSQRYVTPDNEPCTRGSSTANASVQRCGIDGGHVWQGVAAHHGRAPSRAHRIRI